MSDLKWLVVAVSVGYLGGLVAVFSHATGVPLSDTANGTHSS
jgi:hypothetical protein